MNQLIEPVLRPVTRWARRSQQGACRNAMVASTLLAERRRERIEVAEYLDHALGRTTQQGSPARRAGSATPTLPAARLG